MNVFSVVQFGYVISWLQRELGKDKWCAEARHALELSSEDKFPDAAVESSGVPNQEEMKRRAWVEAGYASIKARLDLIRYTFIVFKVFM